MSAVLIVLLNTNKGHFTHETEGPWPLLFKTRWWKGGAGPSYLLMSSVVCAFMERKHIKGHVSSTDNWIYLPHVLYLPRILSIMFAFAMHLCNVGCYFKFQRFIGYKGRQLMNGREPTATLFFNLINEIYHLELCIATIIYWVCHFLPN